MRFRSRTLAAILRAFERTGRLRFLVWPSSGLLGLQVELSLSWKADLGLPASSPWSTTPSSSSSSENSDPATLLQLIVSVTWTLGKFLESLCTCFVESASWKCSLHRIKLQAPKTTTWPDSGAPWSVFWGCQCCRCVNSPDILLHWLLWLLRCLVNTCTSTRQVGLLFKAREVTWYSYLWGMVFSTSPSLSLCISLQVYGPPPGKWHCHLLLLLWLSLTSHTGSHRNVSSLRVSVMPTQNILIIWKPLIKFALPFPLVGFLFVSVVFHSVTLL